MKYKVEYIEETHTYLVNGIIVPSVTQLLDTIFPKKYDSVPKAILDAKASYGSQIHLFIQIIEQKKPKEPIKYLKRYFKMDYIQEESIKQYLNFKKKYNIKIKQCEKIVNYKEKYAGRFDMYGTVNGEECLIDIKTTAEMDKKYLSWQLSLYEKAFKQMKKLYCLWLPKKHLGKLEEINRIDEEFLNSLIGE